MSGNPRDVSDAELTPPPGEDALILSAGLTPAWQQILVFDQVRWGEVNRAREVAWCGSGKVLNAGMAVHRLGGPSLTLAPLGGSPLVEIDREFADLGVPRRWIETRAATRVCTTILDRATGRITELVENGRPLNEDELSCLPRRICRGGCPGRGRRAHRLAAQRCAPFALSRSGGLHAAARWSSISAARACFRSST